MSCKAGRRERERERERESYRGREAKCHIKRAGERVSYRRREMKRDKERAEKTRVRLREGESVGERE